VLIVLTARVLTQLCQKPVPVGLTGQWHFLPRVSPDTTENQSRPVSSREAFWIPDSLNPRSPTRPACARSRRHRQKEPPLSDGCSANLLRTVFKAARNSNGCRIRLTKGELSVCCVTRHVTHSCHYGTSQRYKLVER
jgi:hypothetical protein